VFFKLFFFVTISQDTFMQVALHLTTCYPTTPAPQGLACPASSRFILFLAASMHSISIPPSE